MVGIYLSKGDGTFTLTCSNFEASRTNRNLIPADVSGDGKSDLIYQPAGSGAFGTGTVGVYLASQPLADLMSSISNGMGAVTTIYYTPSTKYANTLLPFPVQTVSEITTNDGNGLITEYSAEFRQPFGFNSGTYSDSIRAPFNRINLIAG